MGDDVVWNRAEPGVAESRCVGQPRTRSMIHWSFNHSPTISAFGYMSERRVTATLTCSL